MKIELYVFSSNTHANILRGYERKQWAVSMADAAQLLKRRQRWSSGIEVGARGIIWSVERRGFCVPFRFASKPKDEILPNVWDEPWRFPFFIDPLAEPMVIAQQRLQWDKWKVTERFRLPVLRNLRPRRQPWDVQIQQMFKGVNGINVFNPNHVTKEEWHEILDFFGGVELVQKDSLIAEPRLNPTVAKIRAVDVDDW